MNKPAFIHPTCVIDENVNIGVDTQIWLWTHVSKNVTIGTNCIIGQNVFIGENVSIGNNVKIAAKTGIMKNIDDNEVIAGYPSEKIFDWHRNTIILKKLRQNDKKK